MLIANDGRPGREAAIGGTLGAPGLRIPALFISTGAALDVRAAGRATISVDAVSEQRRTANVLAETGDGPRVAMAGAHLDSVADGPGMNDDGSGIAALLAAARTLRGTGAGRGAAAPRASGAPRNWACTGRAATSPGSTEAARKAIAAYVNLDMVGTRGGRRRRLPRRRPHRAQPASRAARARPARTSARESLGTSSDHAPFERAGIPVGGVFTGLDRCYHRACDDADNVDPRRVADAAAATAATLLEVGSR